MVEIIYKEESYKIIGACLKVHNKLGPGFLEGVYSEALVLEFNKDEIPFEKEKSLSIIYDGNPLKKKYRADFICYEKIIVELKATNFLYQHDTNQLMNYLKSTKLKLGILVNFGSPSLSYKRIVN